MYGEVEWPVRQQPVQFAGTCCKQFQFQLDSHVRVNSHLKLCSHKPGPQIVKLMCMRFHSHILVSSHPLVITSLKMKNASQTTSSSA
jgi:hypothetical protein